MRRSIACYFRFNSYCQTSQIVVRFSYDNFQTKWLLKGDQCPFSIAGLHFSLTTTHLKVELVQRRLFMMSHVHQALMIIGFIFVVDSSIGNVGSLLSQLRRTSFSLTDDSYLSLRHPSVISVTRIVLPSRFCFTPGTCSFMSAFIVCPICHFTYITHSCLCMHITESHGGPETAISLI